MTSQPLLPLVSQAISGDNEALELLLILKYPFIFWIIRRTTDCLEDAEDITQEVSIRVFQHIAALKSPEAFDSWLRTIVRRECCRYHAAKKPCVSIETIYDWENIFVETDTDCIPAERIETDEFDAALVFALEDMNESSREVFYMRYSKNMRCREIAASTGLSTERVSTALWRGKEKLREKLRCSVLNA